MDRATPRPVGLGCTRKQAEQALGSSAVSSVPASFLLAWFLPPVPALASSAVNCNWQLSGETNPFLPQLPAMVLIPAIESELEQRDNDLMSELNAMASHWVWAKNL